MISLAETGVISIAGTATPFNITHGLTKPEPKTVTSPSASATAETWLQIGSAPSAVRMTIPRQAAGGAPVDWVFGDAVPTWHVDTDVNGASLVFHWHYF